MAAGLCAATSALVANGRCGVSKCCPLYPHERTSRRSIGTSEKCRYCCKSLFARWDSNSPTRRCSDCILMCGTTSPSTKLTGDSGSAFEALLVGDCRLFRSLAENWPLRFLGLLQQYRHFSDLALALRDVRFLG